MKVAESMTATVLEVLPDHSVLDAARLMTARHVGAAVVLDPELPGPGIVTERDVLRCVAAGDDPATTRVADIMTFEARTASPDWDLDQAADAMVTGGFRHLIVMDGRGVVGVISMRDIVRAHVRSHHAGGAHV